MSGFEWLGAALAVGLLVYLFIALLAPERAVVTANSVLQVALYFAVLTALAIPLGRYMAAVYEGNAGIADRVFGPIERAFYRLAGVDPSADMSWRRYAGALLLFNAIGMLAVYAIQRLQALPAAEPGGASPASAPMSRSTPP